MIYSIITVILGFLWLWAEFRNSILKAKIKKLNTISKEKDYLIMKLNNETKLTWFEADYLISFLRCTNYDNGVYKKLEQIYNTRKQGR